MNDTSQDQRGSAAPREPEALVWRRPWTRWRTARVWLVLSWFAVMLAWRILRTPNALLLFQVVSVALLAVVSWPWIRGPYKLYTRGWLPADSRYQPAIAPQTFPFHVMSALNKLGFVVAGILVKDNQPEGRRVEILLHIHPENRDSAQVAAITNRLRTRQLLVFKTRFEDGFAFETGDADTPPTFPSDPELPVFRFPQLRSAADLYRIHQRLKEEFDRHGRPVVGDRAGELAEFVARAEKIHQRHMSRDFKLNAAGDRYVYTVRGAIRLAWLNTWPVKEIRYVRMVGKASKLADSLGLAIHPKLGVLEESVRRPQA